MIGMLAPMASSRIRSVSCARERAEVYATSNLNFLKSSPARRASDSPFALNGTSTQPVNRFSRFQSDWPWRTRTRVGMGRASTQRPRIAQGGRRDRVSLVVRRSAQDLECAVELLEHDHARQPVRQCERREAPDETRLFADARGQAFVAADAQRQLLRGIAELFQPL